MDRVITELWQLANWVKTAVFPCKEEFVQDPSKRPRSQGDIIYAGREKRRRNISSTINQESKSQILTHQQEQLPLDVMQIQHREAMPQRASPVMTSAPRKLTAKEKLIACNVRRHPNAHLIGIERRIIKPEPKTVKVANVTTDSNSEDTTKPTANNRIVKPLAERQWRLQKKPSRQELKETLELVKKSEILFIKAKKQLTGLTRSSIRKTRSPCRHLISSKLINVHGRFILGRSEPAPPTLPDFTLSPICSLQVVQTPFADEKVIEYAEKIKPLLKKTKEDNQESRVQSSKQIHQQTIADDGQANIQEHQQQQQQQQISELINAEDRQMYSSIPEASPEQVFFEIDNCAYVKHDVATLLPGQWLNDNIINGYMKLLQLKDKGQEGGISNHFCKTFLVNSLFPNYCYSNVRRWTLLKKLRNWGQKQPTILDCDQIFFPVHLEVHWVLILADIPDKKIKFYDSLASYLKPDLEPLMKSIARYLVDEAKDKQNLNWNITNFTFEFISESPRQNNGSDCGCFVARNCKELTKTRNTSLVYSPEEMPEYRILMMKELAKGRIL